MNLQNSLLISLLTGNLVRRLVRSRLHRQACKKSLARWCLEAALYIFSYLAVAFETCPRRQQFDVVHEWEIKPMQKAAEPTTLVPKLRGASCVTGEDVKVQGVRVLPSRKPILPCRQMVGFQLRPAERRFCGW
jgi:hypothetical protein